MDHIDEFQSPNFHHVAERCFAALLLITFVALATKRRRLQLREGLIVLFAVYSGLYAARNIPVSSLLLVMVTGPLLSEAFDSLSSRRGLRFGIGAILARVGAFSARMGKIEAGLRGHVWAVAAVVLVCFVVSNGGRWGSRRLMDVHFDGKRFPVEAVSYLAKREPGSPVLAPDYWGGYVIYRLYPKTLVAMDDRHDLYGEEYLKSYLKTMHVEPGWEDFLREHGIQCVLMARGSALANILAETKGWKPIYADDLAIAFARVSGGQG